MARGTKPRLPVWLDPRTLGGGASGTKPPTVKGRPVRTLQPRLYVWYGQCRGGSGGGSRG